MGECRMKIHVETTHFIGLGDIESLDDEIIVDFKYKDNDGNTITIEMRFDDTKRFTIRSNRMMAVTPMFANQIRINPFSKG